MKKDTFALKLTKLIWAFLPFYNQIKMKKQNNFTLIKRAKQLAIEETKAKVLKLIERAKRSSGFCGIGEWTGSDDIDLMFECLDKMEEEVAKIK